MQFTPNDITDIGLLKINKEAIYGVVNESEFKMNYPETPT
jgi:hypothetical protein